MNFATTILADVLAIFFASRLLDCKLAKLKWVLHLVIILHSVSLLLSAFNWAMYTCDKRLYRESSVYVHTVHDKPQTPRRRRVSSLTLTLIGVIALALLALSILLIFIDVYFLYTLFICDTTWFLIYIVVLLVNMFTTTQRISWHKSCATSYGAGGV